MMNRCRWMMTALLLVLLLVAGCSRSGADEPNKASSQGSISVQGSGNAQAKTLAEVLAQGKNQPGVYCEYVVKPDQGAVLQGKLWIAGENLRSESTDPGSKGTAIFIRYHLRGYNYIFTSGETQAIKATDTQPAEDINPVQTVRDVDANTQPLGKEIKDGKNCVVVKYKQDEVENRVWIWEDYGVPVRIESTYDKSTTVMEYSNYKFDPIPESIFELPPGMKVMELPGLGSGNP